MSKMQAWDKYRKIKKVEGIDFRKFTIEELDSLLDEVLWNADGSPADIIHDLEFSPLGDYTLPFLLQHLENPNFIEEYDELSLEQIAFKEMMSEILDSRSYIDYGVSVRTAWRTDQGTKVLNEYKNMIMELLRKRKVSILE